MRYLRIVPKALLIILLPASLAACTQAAPSSMSVASAYETSGVVSTGPYTRTIFSTHNF
jgi:hypothetical protein